MTIQDLYEWANECQSKHPIKEALYAARKAVEREPRKIVRCGVAVTVVS